MEQTWVWVHQERLVVSRLVQERLVVVWQVARVVQERLVVWRVARLVDVAA